MRKNMTNKHSYIVRNGYGTDLPLIEICGDHRAIGFPRVSEILSSSLGSQYNKHPIFDVVKIGLSTDEFISFWVYSGGEYEINDDIFGLFIHPVSNHIQVVNDIEEALIGSGNFARKPEN